jgi:hypothetical protein
VRIVVSLLMLYLHLGPFSRQVMAAIDRRIAALDREIPADVSATTVSS